ncbi:MAG: Response regulatory domain-containing protein [Succiniclasticum sp.]
MAKILVVDDNSQLNSMLKDVLESWKHTVFVMEDGYTCVETARRELPDIIFLDIMLPGLSGYEVCSTLKKDPALRETAVILMTALSDVESRIHGYSCGADLFLSKPVHFDELRVLIDQFLQRKRNHETMEARYAVAETLNSIFTMVLHRPTPINKMKLVYCNKLLQGMDWTPEEEEQARIACMLVPIQSLFRETEYNLDRLLEAMKPLKMAAWLTPIIRFLAAPPEKREQYLPALAAAHCEKPAQLSLLIAHYITLYNQTKGDRRRILAILNEEDGQAHYDPAILRRLTELINAEIVFESIQS